MPNPIRPPYRLEQVLNAVAAFMQISPDRMRSSERTAEVVDARWLFAAACRQLTQHSYPEIAAAMGRRSHTGALWGARHAERWGAGELQSQIAHVRAILDGQLAPAGKAATVPAARKPVRFDWSDEAGGPASYDSAAVVAELAGLGSRGHFGASSVSYRRDEVAKECAR